MKAKNFFKICTPLFLAMMVFLLPGLVSSNISTQALLCVDSDHGHAAGETYSFHDEEGTSHSHSHRHSPDEPLHNHEHSHSGGVKGQDAKVASERKSDRFVPNLDSEKLSFLNQELCCQGYLQGIFRPPIA